MKLNNLHIIWLKVIIHFCAIVPLTFAYYQGVTDQLGGDPVKEIIHFTGIGSLNLLLLSLMVTPISRLRKLGLLMRIRRLIGLYAFFYACLHLANFILFELKLEWQLIAQEIIERPYITVGFIAWCILFVLALTSPQMIKRRLKSNWQTIHNYVYLASILVILHFLWSVKLNLFEPSLYAIFLIILFYFRRNKFKSITTLFERNKHT